MVWLKFSGLTVSFKKKKKVQCMQNYSYLHSYIQGHNYSPQNQLVSKVPI